MKLASYFLISIAFHAVVLSFPIAVFETGREQAVPVVLLVETREMPARASAGRNPAQRSEKKTEKNLSRIPPIEKAVETILEPTEPDQKEPVKEAVLQSNIFPPLMEKVIEERPPAEEAAGPDVKPAARKVISSPSAAREREKSSEQPKEPASLHAKVRFEDEKEATPAAEIVFARAGYAYNPKPHYPEEARREGWEGEVFLRVLVDPEGRPESIELSRSSGFEALDQAAVQSVKSWRFQPARYGDRRVESWVKIPIVFRLAYLKN